LQTGSLSESREMWGAQASLLVWLERQKDRGVTRGYDLRARFRIEKKNDGSRMSGEFERTWHVPGPDPSSTARGGFQPGTWHHLLFNFFVPLPGTPGGENTTLYVDGHARPGKGSTRNDWPTEIEAHARMINQLYETFKRYVQNIVEVERQAGANIRNVSLPTFDVNDPKYRKPVQIPIGESVWIGGLDPRHGAVTHPEPDLTTFYGLVDNVIFQNRWNKPMPSLGSNEYTARFDTFRPSTGKSESASTKLVFTKHTPSLEYQRPLRILGYDLTAWKQVKSSSGGDTYVSLGDTYLRFGWLRGSGDPYTLLATGATYDPSTDASGWTAPLEAGAPYNSLVNGYLLPARDPGAPLGFLTKGLPPDGSVEPEFYFYALEVKPSTLARDAQTGPRMAPVVDDVSVVYAPATGPVVMKEEVSDESE
jgi:hypothetical protein